MRLPSAPDGTRPVLGGARAVELGVVALAVVAVFALVWRYMDLLGDSFWSVATGRWILAHGALPAVDPFSFTADRVWLVHMPLSQVLLAVVEGAFGILALELFGTLVFGASLLLLWLPHAPSGLAKVAAWPWLLLLVVVQADDLCVRGQLFGDLAFSLLLLLLFRLRDQLRVRLPLFAVLGCLWINLHASVFLGLSLPLAFAAGGYAHGARDFARRCLGAAGYLALGMLANPYGYKLVWDLVTLFGSANTQQIDLFRPPNFREPAVLLSFTLCGASALFSFRQGGRRALPELFALGALTVAAIAGRRYLPLAVALAVVVLCRLLSRVELERERFRLFPRALLAGCAALVAAIGCSTDKDPWRDVPLVEAELIERLALPAHIANVYHWGGYLDYAWNGRIKVFVDGRNQLFENGAFAEVGRLDRLEGWRELLDRRRINTVLWESRSRLDAALAVSPDWLLVRRGPIAVVYTRRRPLDVGTDAP